MDNIQEPKNSFDALVLALRLSIEAPTKKQSEKALKMAKYFSNILTEIEVARAKKECLKQLEGHKQ
tara:strand:+ start:313 stop:510 length:198 start_codon:yes stop_codon:yes gene_type:complete